MLTNTQVITEAFIDWCHTNKDGLIYKCNNQSRFNERLITSLLWQFPQKCLRNSTLQGYSVLLAIRKFKAPIIILNCYPILGHQHLHSKWPVNNCIVTTPIIKYTHLLIKREDFLQMVMQNINISESLLFLAVWRLTKHSIAVAKEPILYSLYTFDIILFLYNKMAIPFLDVMWVKHLIFCNYSR